MPSVITHHRIATLSNHLAAVRQHQSMHTLHTTLILPTRGSWCSTAVSAHIGYIVPTGNTHRAHGNFMPRGAVKQAWSISWLYGIKGDLNQAFISLGLVLFTFVVFFNCRLAFCVVSYIFAC